MADIKIEVSCLDGDAQGIVQEFFTCYWESIFGMNHFKVSINDVSQDITKCHNEYERRVYGKDS